MFESSWMRARSQAPIAVGLVVTLWSCSNGGTTGLDPVTETPPLVAALELTDETGTPLPDTLRAGSNEGPALCVRARDPEGRDITGSLASLSWGGPHRMLVGSSDPLVARFAGLLFGLNERGLLCGFVQMGRPGIATITFTYVGRGLGGPSASVTLRHRELG